MEDKKGIKVIAALIAAVALVLIVVAIVMSLSSDDKTKEKETDGYKQCAEENLSSEKKKTNFEHTKQNYYLDEENNRINNSEEITKSHDSIGENGKAGKFTITDMTIKSENCDENRAILNASLTNNSEEEFADLMLLFNVKDKDGNITHTFGITVEKIGVGETTAIEFKTLGRIIDIYDYEFTYAEASERVG